MTTLWRTKVAQSRLIRVFLPRSPGSLVIADIGKKPTTETRRHGAARSEETQPQIHAEQLRSEMAICVDLRDSATTRFLFFSVTSVPPCLRGGFFRLESHRRACSCR